MKIIRITFFSVLTTEAHMNMQLLFRYIHIYDSVNLPEKQNHGYL